MGKRKRNRVSRSRSPESSREINLKIIEDLRKRLLRLEREKSRRSSSRSNNYLIASSPSRSRRSHSRHRERHFLTGTRVEHRSRNRSRSIASTRTSTRTAVEARQRRQRRSRSQSLGCRSRSPRQGRRDRAGPRRIESADRSGNNENACSFIEGGSNTANSRESSVNELIIHNDEEIPEDFLEILGKNPEKEVDTGFALHAELVPRWRDNLLNGMQKDEAVALLNQYDLPSNLPNLAPPKLNPEIATLIKRNNLVKIRDASQSEVQNQLGKGISALGKGITAILNSKEPLTGDLKKDLLKDFCDSGKILSNLFHRISVSRKNCILPLLNENIKDSVDKCPPTEFLFGSDLTEKIKSLKNLENVGKVLKTPSNFSSTPRTQKKEGGNQKDYTSKNFKRPARQSTQTGYRKGYTPRTQLEGRTHSYYPYKKDKVRRKD